MHTQDISQLNLSQPEVNARFAEIEAQNPDLTELTDRAFAEASMHPENVLGEQIRDQFEDRFGEGWLKKLNDRSERPVETVAQPEPASGEENQEVLTIRTIEALSPEAQRVLIQQTTAYVAEMHHHGDFVLAV